MKLMSSLVISSILLTGCANNNLAITPAPPKFDTSSFSLKKDKQIKYWVEKSDNDTYIVMRSVEFYGLIEDTKLLKEDYNLLLNSINNFNNELNKEKH